MRRLVRDSAARLGEHFDSVLVLAVTRDSDGAGNEIKVLTQIGSLYAVLGAVREYQLEQEQYVRTHANRQQLREYRDGPNDTQTP